MKTQELIFNIFAIIDLADIKSDDPMSDFKRIAKEKYNKQFLPFVIKGYGKTNKKRIDMHRFLLTIYAILGCYRRRNPRRTKVFIKKLKKILEKN